MEISLSWSGPFTRRGYTIANPSNIPVGSPIRGFVKRQCGNASQANSAYPFRIEASQPGMRRRMVKQFGRLRGRRMSAKIALSRRMEPLQTEADRNSGFKHYTLRNWALSGA